MNFYELFCRVLQETERKKSKGLKTPRPIGLTWPGFNHTPTTKQASGHCVEVKPICSPVREGIYPGRRQLDSAALLLPSHQKNILS